MKKIVRDDISLDETVQSEDNATANNKAGEVIPDGNSAS
jgi:hypothetical protein